MKIIAEDIPGCELSERELELPEAVEQYRKKDRNIGDGKRHNTGNKTSGRIVVGKRKNKALGIQKNDAFSEPSLCSK